MNYFVDHEKCEVTFPYKSINDDELDLLPGQIITIISKNLEDPGWWKGRLNGKVGVFPDNFVKIIKITSESGTVEKPVPQRVGSVEEKFDLDSLKKELIIRLVIKNYTILVIN